MHFVRRVCPVVGLFLSPIVLAQTAIPALPPVPHDRLQQLTAKAGFFNEPSVAINPKNPKQIAVAYQIDATVAVSNNGGRTWRMASGTAPKDYKVSGDVSVTYDAKGRLFLCYIAFDKLGTSQYWGHNATRNGIFVRRSLDGGKTWDAAARAVFQQRTKPGIPFEDKPYIVADTTHGPYAGNLYVGWTQFGLKQSLLLFSRSTDGGVTWSKPIRISTVAGLPRDDNGAVEGFTGAVSPDGTLNVAWSNGDQIVFAQSHDGGRSFTPSHGIIQTAPSMFDVEGVSRANGFPVLGSDARGRLFLTWSDYRNGDVDVFCAYSTDGGATWGGAVRVNSEPLHSGTDQFFPWMAVDPKSGAVYIDFYDRRRDPLNEKTAMTLARSTDGGQSFTNYAWTENQFKADGDFIGDYTGLAAYGGHVIGAWAEERPDANAKAGASRVKAQSAKKRQAHGDEEGPAKKSVRETILRVGSAEFQVSHPA